MPTAERMAIVVAAAANGLVTSGQLSRRLKVSQRTIYRYVARLKRAGVNIKGEAGIGYMLMPSRTGSDHG